MIRLSQAAITFPKTFVWLPTFLTVLVIGLVAAPTVSEKAATVLHPLTVDADPENMLFYDDPVRVFHRQQRETFSLYDLIVVGVVNTKHPNGVFNAKTLKNVYDLTEYAKGIQWQNEAGETEGVISIDLIAPSTVDNIEQAGPGTVKFDWLMSGPPASDAEALAVREKARKLPLLNGSLLSENGQALALYIPITSKGVSYQITNMLRERMATYDTEDDEYLISGLPVAQDTFAVEMFKEMAISTPIAMGLIFALLWYFFRNVRLILSPMIVANLSVMLTMGLLIISGNAIHIMSSMIPIFIMPVSVLDAIHILSEFYDRYPQFKDRKKTIQHVMNELSTPMLYTSLTTCVGFVSLNLTPIPPIQVFGTFVAVGVGLAWLMTVTLIPAYIVRMPEAAFANFGLKQKTHPEHEHYSFMARFLESFGGQTLRHARVIIIGVLAIGLLSVYGIKQIVANDNPVKWFARSHELRLADNRLNEMFAGTYMAYLSLGTPASEKSVSAEAGELKTRLAAHPLKPMKHLAASLPKIAVGAESREALFDGLIAAAENEMDAAPLEALDDWEQAVDTLESWKAENETFKDPEVLNYISALQNYLQETGDVGKSNSIVQIVKTVYRELFSGDETQYRIPDKAAAVAQTLITFQSSHRPQDLWHFVTPDFRQANLWLQLKSGDNVDMSRVEQQVKTYFEQNPPPRNLQHRWFGLNYINVTWQEQMVLGMAKALAGSFVIVLIMMTFLFRSLLWGLLAMIPLSFSVAVLYGVVGFMGKDYDAPIAILSALSLGLAVDYAIHFLSRSRELRLTHNNWNETVSALFGEPARAITRNVIVVGVGFLPLLLAPLVPYQTVGIFISAILIFSGFATLAILPALIGLMENRLFRAEGRTI